MHSKSCVYEFPSGGRRGGTVHVGNVPNMHVHVVVSRLVSPFVMLLYMYVYTYLKAFLVVGDLWIGRTNVTSQHPSLLSEFPSITVFKYKILFIIKNTSNYPQISSYLYIVMSATLTLLLPSFESPQRGGCVARGLSLRPPSSLFFYVWRV